MELGAFSVPVPGIVSAKGWCCSHGADRSCTVSTDRRLSGFSLFPGVRLAKEMIENLYANDMFAVETDVFIHDVEVLLHQLLCVTRRRYHILKHQNDVLEPLA